MDIKFDLNEFRARISKIETDIETDEQGSTGEELGKIKSYDKLVDTENSFWSQVELIARLRDGVSAAISEAVTLEGKEPGKWTGTLAELNKLSERVIAAMVAVMGAFRRLSGRKNELYEELSVENKRNYNRYLGALPGDWDEGC